MIRLKGILVEKHQPRTFANKRGVEWQSMSFVIRTSDNNRLVYFQTKDEQIMNMLDKMPISSKIIVGFFIDSNNNTGHWMSNNFAIRLCADERRSVCIDNNDIEDLEVGDSDSSEDVDFNIIQQ